MSQIALLFPGQGAQRVGMAQDLHDAFPAVGRWFAAASEAAGLDLARLCFEGPDAELTRTCNAQPAILTASIAALLALMEGLGVGQDDINCRLRIADGKLQVAAAAGLSLGEYTALVAAGAISPLDGVRLVRQRGLFMEEAGAATGGAMASILGLERDVVDGACRDAGGIVVGANYNAPGQIVISGEPAAVERAGALCKERGARRVIPLNVSGAFHSPLMQPAADRLSVELERTAISDAGIPVVANVTASNVSTAGDIRSALAAQVTGSVFWDDSVRRMVADGVTAFVEVGPGTVLAGLVKRIAPEARVLPAGDAASVEAAVGALVN